MNRKSRSVRHPLLRQPLLTMLVFLFAIAALLTLRLTHDETPFKIGVTRIHGPCKAKVDNYDTSTGDRRDLPVWPGDSSDAATFANNMTEPLRRSMIWVEFGSQVRVLQVVPIPGTRDSAVLIQIDSGATGWTRGYALRPIDD